MESKQLIFFKLYIIIIFNHKLYLHSIKKKKSHLFFIQFFY